MEPSYTITEAVQVTGRSRPTLRRYLDAGRFPNAFRDPEAGEHGPWRIPAGDLRAAGFTIEADTADDTTAPDHELRSQLAVALAVAEERARTIEMLRAQLEQLQDTLRAVAAR